MKSLLRLSGAFFLAELLCSFTVRAQSPPDVLSFINPLIGTENGGHVFPGATLPYGMAKAVSDVNGDDQGGYATDNSNITGFSHMHDSGTGGSPSLGNFPIFPQAGCPGDDIDRCRWARSDRAVPRINSSVEASPGYFAITLATQVHAEMTVSNHTALYRFTFPATPTEPDAPLSPLFLVDLLDLPMSRSNGTAQVDPTTGRLTGNGTFNPSFGQGTYDLHFCADFSGAPVRDTGVWINNRAGNYPKNITVVPDNVNTELPVGAWVQFEAPTTNNQIMARVGVSFISVDQACTNAETEIPTYDFNGTLSTAQAAWRDQMSPIQIDAGGANDSFQTVFWSGIYRSMISPQDYTGQQPLWNSSEPYFDSFYCIWDAFRAQMPLLVLLDPINMSRMLRALVDFYRFEGKLPDCHMSLCYGFTQGGSNADIVIVDAYLKNITGVDWNLAYEAMLSDAYVEPLDWSIMGRGGLHSWEILGYIPADDFDPYGVGPFTRSISRTVEYAYDNFCIAEMAQAMGKTADYESLLLSSQNWINLWNPTQNSSINGTDTGFVGFLQPKFLNETTGYQNPAICSPVMNFTSCYLNPTGTETYEGSPWLYSFFAPHSMGPLVQFMGGPERFVQRLDYLHESGILYIGDEQAFLPVYQYHYAGRPGRSAYRAHTYIPSQFNDTFIGIPGNDDSGAMGSFSTFAMIGLFPNPGQDVYLITPPFFREVNITSKQTGNKATIRNVNFDAAYNNIYIQSATLNGQAYTKNWITHSFFIDGGVLELTLGSTESAWGTNAADLPPSLELSELPIY